MDRRIKKTRSAVLHAAFELLMEKDIDKITVLEICQKADINKSTFYLHYKNAEDCFRQCIDTLMDQLLAYCQDFDYYKIQEHPEENISLILDQIEAAKPTLEKFKDSKFSGQVIKELTEKLVKGIAETNGFTKDNNFYEIVTITFMVGGFVDAIIEPLPNYDREVLRVAFTRILTKRKAQSNLTV